jgi:outer membrane lipoprotein SlyB
MKKFLAITILVSTLTACASNPPERWEIGTVTMVNVYEKTVQDTSGVGAIGGAAAGAAIGNQFGKGSGKDWATGVGAVAGLLLGDAVEGEMNTRKETWFECYVNLDSGISFHLDKEINDFYRGVKANDRVNVQIGHTIFGSPWYRIYPLPKNQHDN